jgi:predicted SprT family Zn-dependent metalloprotease
MRLGIVAPIDRTEDRTNQAITPVEYGGLQTAYEHFNAELFEDALPNVLITYQRHAHMRGHFAAERYIERGADQRCDEIALNPDGFIERTDEQILSILVHEQVHVWQGHHGTAPKRNYHNREWAAKMKVIGLQPSNTGAVGGKETGAQMSHYIVPGGLFARSYEQLRAKGWKLNLESTPVGNPAAPRRNKVKFTCPRCGQKAWGKPDLAVTCTPCGAEMRADGGESAQLGS